MRVAVLFLLVSVIGVTGVVLVRFLFGKATWRLSLRSLMVLVAVVAVLLAGTIAYRRAAMASFQWVGADTTEAKQLFPTASIRENEDGRFQFEYFARHRSIQRLLTKVDGVSYRVGDEAIVITAQSFATAQEQLKAIRNADKLPNGALVIRGRVRELSGKPLAGAHVDILGRFVFINCCKTRDDGTFTLALTDENPSVPAGSGYYFRIRHPAESKDALMRWHSRYFSLDRSNPELVADILVPE